MCDPGLTERIEKRIRESKRAYSGKEQIAEIIARNDEFYWVFEPDAHKHNGWGLDGLDWKCFLIAWGIKTDWDGRRETLADSILSHPEIFFRRWLTQEKIGVLSCGLQPSELSTALGAAWAERIPTEEEYIYIRIRSTTGKKDLEKLWPIIEKIKRDVYQFATRSPRTFGRDLCWYDLHGDEQFGKLSLGQIRNKWRIYFPKQRQTSRVVIQKAIERIESMILRLAPLWG